MGNSPLQPDIRAALATLFELFLAFTRARSQSSRDALESQILSVFASLGATSETLVQDARTQFEFLREEPIREARISSPWESAAKRLVNANIRSFEARTRNIKLTKGARDMLRIPVIETAKLNDEFDSKQIEGSLDKILNTIEVESSKRKSWTRTSIDVIRAFHQNFCNIPPFCAGKQNEQR